MQRNEENDIATVRCFCFFVKEQTHAFYKLNLYFYSNYYILHLSDGLHFMHHFNFSSIISFSSIYITKLAIVNREAKHTLSSFRFNIFLSSQLNVFFFPQIVLTAKPERRGNRGKSIPWWVYLLSALGGILLLTGVIFLLYKVCK